MLTKEEMIKKATEFEAELTALTKRYGANSYSFVSFLDDGTGEGAYPVMVHWVREGYPVTSKHPKIIKLCFQSSVQYVRALTGKGLMHEYVEGFGRFDTGMKDL